MLAVISDNRLYICLACQKKWFKRKNTTPSSVQQVRSWNYSQVTGRRRLEKVLISRTVFKKIAIIHGKDEFLKIKGNICNAPKETESVNRLAK